MKLRRHYNSPAPGLVRQKSFQLGSGGNGRNNSGKNGEVPKPSAECHPSNITTQIQRGSSSHYGSDHGGKSNGDPSARTQSQPNSGVVDITDQFDYTFWAGDLNYRVNVTRAEAEECLQRGDLKVRYDPSTPRRDVNDLNMPLGIHLIMSNRLVWARCVLDNAGERSTDN